MIVKSCAKRAYRIARQVWVTASPAAPLTFDLDRDGGTLTILAGGLPVVAERFSDGDAAAGFAALVRKYIDRWRQRQTRYLAAPPHHRPHRTPKSRRRRLPKQFMQPVAETA